jgi:hypothetical protein
MRRNGWLESMKVDLERLNIPRDELDQAKAHELANVRFRRGVFALLDPPEPFSDQAIFSLRYRRYSAYLLGVTQLATLPHIARRGRRPATHFKPTERRPRRSTPAGFQDPRHDRLQNAVYDFLVARYSDVEYEADWMDLRASVAGPDASSW